MNLEDARRIYQHPGPFATVYLDTESEVAQPGQRLELEWKNARRDLEQAGADDETVAAVEAVVAEGHRGGDTLAAVAAGGEVLLVERLPDPPKRSIARWAPIPSLGPLFEWAQSFVPHVVVLADREGADVVAFAGNDVTVDAELHGDTEHIHRGKPGGWSQRRFQQRAENTWEHNASDVAQAVTTLVDELRAGLVVVAGDVRAVQLMREALPARVGPLVRVLDHGQRARGVSVDDIADDVVKQVATVVAERTVELMREFREERGQHDRAADGPARTLEALARAQVRTLLVHDDPADERTGWFGPEPAHVATDAATLEAMGVDEPREGRLVDVVMRAAAGTGAEVRIVPVTTGGGPTDGVGAILRHTGTAP